MKITYQQLSVLSGWISCFFSTLLLILGINDRTRVDSALLLLAGVFAIATFGFKAVQGKYQKGHVFGLSVIFIALSIFGFCGITLTGCALFSIGLLFIALQLVEYAANKTI